MRFILDGTAELVMQPARYKILSLLQSSARPLFVEQIAKETEVHPRMVSHHLDALEEKGLIVSKYEIAKVEGSKRGVAVRLCKATPHAQEVLENIKESIKIRS
ncbi:MAG: MarR family transcriptional regulator [Nitrososphaerales archaeon]|jgi:DNA-binding transcriptional ArsR family regulator